MNQSELKVTRPSENYQKSSQVEKGRAFRALHERAGTFIIPNPWDAGSARLLQHAVFQALATTSMGRAFSLGQRDGTLGRQRTLEYAALIAAATSLPVSADLENCFGDTPQAVAETIRLAAKTGIVGGSVEDSTGDHDRPIYDLDLAVERVAAAVKTARSLPFDFVLTARAENYLHGRRDLDDTIKRLQAYERAGADVLYAPGISTEDEIRAVVQSVRRPVNVIMGRKVGVQLRLSELSALGVKRISVGSALCRTALGALTRAANEMMHQGTFTFAASAVDPKDMDPIFTD